MAGEVEGTVYIDGLREMLNSLKNTDPEARKRVLKAGREVATHVKNEAIGKARLAPNPRQAARAAQSLRLQANQKGVGIVLGGSGKREWAIGSEYGSLAYGQFPRWKGNRFPSTWIDEDGPGYWLQPAIRTSAQFVEDNYLQAVHDAIAASSNGTLR